MNNRLNKLFEAFEEIDAMLVYSPLNIRYLSGFTGSTAYLYISKKNQILLTDFRYIEQASNECKGFEIIDLLQNGLIATINECIKKDSAKKIAFESSITYQEYQSLLNGLKSIELIAGDQLIEDIRMIKDDSELELIQHAVSIGDQAFTHILDFIKPGITELEIALELEYFMKKQGATKLSFDSIVASGIHSSMPHASPTDKKIENGDFLTLDFGCIYKGYCSDMTRTVVIGKASDQQKNIYQKVLEAQLKAINSIKAGLHSTDIDKLARDVIDSAGYKDNFGHGLGHGVGLYIHENPRLSPIGKYTLLENMVVTVEPGIYIQGFGGVRIEDMVVVKNNGCNNFTHSPKELIEL